MARTRTADREPLSQRSIVATAIAIADEEGTAQLSMRNLARRLGYEVMSLYNHVASKSELLELMLEAVSAEVDDPHDTDPLAAIRAQAVATHAMFLRHQWAADVWLQHIPGPNRVAKLELLLSLLAKVGLPERVAHVGFHAVNNHVLGHAMQVIGLTLGRGDIETLITSFLAGLSPDTHPHMIAHVHQHLVGDEGDSFGFVLDLILDALVRTNH